MYISLLIAMTSLMTNASDPRPNISVLPIHFYGTRTVKTAAPGNQCSERIWWIQNEHEWSGFCEATLWRDRERLQTPTIDWRKCSVIVVKNTHFLNRIRLISASENEANTLHLGIRETRSAKRVDRSYNFVAVVIPRSIVTVSDGTTTIKKPSLIKKPRRIREK